MQLQAIAGGYTQNVINGCMQNLILNNMQPKVQLHDERALGSAPGRPSASAAFHRPQLWMRAQARSPRPISLRRLSARTISRSSNKAGKNMIDEHFEGRSGSRHYSRWPDPWRREDDWGPITAAVLFFVILAGLVVYGSGAHL
jgi:hypothetical protein